MFTGLRSMGPLTWVLLGAAIGLVSGAGGVLAIKKKQEPTANASETVEATGKAVSDGIEASTGSVEAALSPANTQAETQQLIAMAPPATVLAAEVADSGCLVATLALAEYSAALSASQGKEGAAAVNVEDSQEDVSLVVKALLSVNPPCAGGVPTAPNYAPPMTGSL